MTMMTDEKIILKLINGMERRESGDAGRHFVHPPPTLESCQRRVVLYVFTIRTAT